MTPLRIRTELNRLARDELARQELEAADRRDRIVGIACVALAVMFFFIDIAWRA